MLSSSEAEEGNEKTDQQIREFVVKIKDDCTRISKALADQSEHEAELKMSAVDALDRIADNLQDVVPVLRGIERAIAVANLSLGYIVKSLEGR
ncbi:MAG: hypothetical protein KA714_10640 [Limnoraphis sp. WC205]|nr:hypothetical protein [Limnoraphis sp. WC205]